MGPVTFSIELTMAQKQIGRNTGRSGRIHVSGDELDKLDLAIGDGIEVDVVDAKEVAHALIDSKDTEQFLIVTPA
ncbi:hypothetical protein [Haloarchaeobius sp. TZWSO28]|uniref:hypothetical protein n=1 Tax=Haloarchaeobius sp. TZWSO28 TaxID=3446119 RepID=UPI003EB72F0E